MAHQSNPLRNLQLASLALALLGVVICTATSWNEPNNLWRAYLTGYIACWPIALGAAGLLAIGNLTGGRWAQASRPFHLAAARTIPVVAILFVPIALGVKQTYPWAAASSEGMQLLPSGKAAYLEPTFFLGRAAAYLVVWLVVIELLCHVSQQAVSPGSTRAARRLGAMTLVTLVPTATFAAFDWAMSLEPQWHSSIYGAIVIAGGVLAAHALSVCGLVATRDTYGVVEAVAVSDGTDSHEIPPVVESPETDTAAQLYNDLGNLLLALLMVFGYLTFSQFLIIWSANLPSEVTWYVRRLAGGWQWLALGMVALLVVAFFQLLSRDRKRTPLRLAGMAGLVIAAYLLHCYWQIVPAFHDSGPAWQAANVAALSALFGAWMAAFLWYANRSLERVPQRQPSGKGS